MRGILHILPVANCYCMPVVGHSRAIFLCKLNVGSLYFLTMNTKWKPHALPHALHISWHL